MRFTCLIDSMLRSDPHFVTRHLSGKEVIWLHGYQKVFGNIKFNKNYCDCFHNCLAPSIPSQVAMRHKIKLSKIFNAPALNDDPFSKRLSVSIEKAEKVV